MRVVLPYATCQWGLVVVIEHAVYVCVCGQTFSCSIALALYCTVGVSVTADTG